MISINNSDFRSKNLEALFVRRDMFRSSPTLLGWLKVAQRENHKLQKFRE